MPAEIVKDFNSKKETTFLYDHYKTEQNFHARLCLQ